ncbi:MAG: low affinity iron permease family protein [Ktedonobacteraceae bacterium]|nr:low affinity iron permease family protein [Ktedonobacteraceae bacterium]
MNVFVRFARSMSSMLGHPLAFGMAVLVIVVWAITGPIFHFSNTWQLVINTGTTIVTFLMVFLIQNSQNRDSKVVQVKLDELIRALKSADNSILDTEHLTEQELSHLQDHYTFLAQVAEKKLSQQKKQGSIQ